MRYNNHMNNNEYLSEIAQIFEMEIDGETGSAWLEMAIDGDFTEKDFGIWLMKNDFEVLGERKGVNGWSECQIKGDLNKIVQVIREFY